MARQLQFTFGALDKRLEDHDNQNTNLPSQTSGNVRRDVSCICCERIRFAQKRGAHLFWRSARQSFGNHIKRLEITTTRTPSLPPQTSGNVRRGVSCICCERIRFAQKRGAHPFWRDWLQTTMG